MYKAAVRWLVRRNIRLLSEGNYQPTLAMFAPDATLAFPGENSWARMYREPEKSQEPFVTHRGRAEIEAFLQRKWQRELDYRLIKELWAYDGNRIAVRFAYEWRDAGREWFRSYGNENWEFDAQGLMRLRFASINDLPLAEGERQFRWPQGRRPDDHPGLSQLGM